MKEGTRNGLIIIRVEKSLQDSVVNPTLIYGSEAWTMSERFKPKVRVVEMSYLRNAYGITWRDRMRN